MSDFSDKLSLIRALIDAAPKWNPEAQKSASRALFWLCEHLRSEVEQRCPTADRVQYLSGKLRGLQDYADTWSHSGKIDPEPMTDCLKGLQLLGDVPDVPLP